MTGRQPYANPALTGIRAVACLWVVLSHIAIGYTPGLPVLLQRLMAPGFLGVDLFFILSGFILTCVHPRLDFGPVSLSRFFLKRIFRIYPLNVAVMLFMAANAWRLGTLGSAWYDPHHFLPYLFMTAVFYTAPPITGWLATNWSLGIEFVCYFGFPFAVRLFHAVPRLVLPLIFLALLIGEGAVTRGWLGVAIGEGAMLRGAVGFALGSVGAILVRDSRLAAWPASLAELACVLAILICLLTQRLWPIPPLMAGLILAVSCRTGVCARFLATRPAVWLGDISFSIYLVHGVLLGEWAWYWLAVSRWHIAEPLVSWLWAGGFLLATILISAGTYYAIEVPCRRLGGALADALRSAGPRRKALAPPA